jgi:hypothetical protein
MDLGSGASVAGTLHIIVTGHDCAPYEGTASILSSAALTLVKPNGGEIWQVGTTDTIVWSSTGLSEGTISIELNRDYPSESWETLYSGIPVENSTQLWPITGPGSSEARMRISSESFPAIHDESDGSFSLVAVPQVVVSRSGNDAQLRWISTGSPYYRIYSDTTPFGTYSTLEGSTADTLFTDSDAFAEGEMKFYRLVCSTEP